MNNQLYDDLERYANETFTKKDLRAGLRLIAELAGIGTIAGVGLGLTSLTIPYIGPRLSYFILRGGAQLLVNWYVDLNAEDRRLVRAVLNKLPINMFSSAASNAADMEFFADVVDTAATIEDAAGDVDEIIAAQQEGKQSIKQ